MAKWTTLPDKETTKAAIEALKANNIEAFLVENGQEAKQKILEMLPFKLRVLASRSVTLEQTGIKDEIDDSGKFVSVRKEYMSFDHKKEADKIRISRSTPDIIVGSVHAVTKDGKVMIASNTGSQIAAYASSAGKVIWVVGAQKIVDNLEEGFKRIYEYDLPKESERLFKEYGVPSHVSKILIFDRESDPQRVKLIFVNEVLGF